MQEKKYFSGMLTCDRHFVLTASTDSVIRHWNLKNPEASFRVSAPRDDDLEGHLFYKGQLEGSTTVFEEHVTREYLESQRSGLSVAGDSSLVSSKSSTISTVREIGKKTEDSVTRTKSLSTSIRDKPLRVSRPKGIAPPPTAHTDVITDLKCLEFPFRMLVSSGRSGKIKVWV